MNKTINNLIGVINNNYSITKNLKLQKKILQKTFITQDLINISNYNINNHIKMNKLFFNNQNYNKLLLHENDYLKYYLITWNSQALTKLHNHDKECLFKVCHGGFEQTILSQDNNFLKSFSKFGKEDVCFVKVGDFHQMKNTSNHFSISLHIYNKNE